MFQCTVKFFEDDNTSCDDQQDGSQSQPPCQEQSQSCYASADNYLLAFYNDAKNKEPFYELNVGEHRYSFEPSNNSITLTHKKKSHPLLTIWANTTTLEKIQQTFESYSKDKVVWNLLMDTPYHCPKDSYLTSVDKSFGPQGVLSFFMIIAIYSKIRDVIENHQTHGLLPMPEMGEAEKFLVVFGVACFLITVGLMMAIEKLALKNIISNKTAAFLESVNIAQAFILPVLYYQTYTPYIAVSMVYIILSLATILKVMSYTHMMHELRKALPKILDPKSTVTSLRTQVSQENLEVIQRYASNPSGLVNLKDVLYFFFAPVLVYQLWYPRSERINKGRAVRLFVEIILLQSFQLYWMNQFMIPILKSSTEIFKNATPAEKITNLLDGTIVYLIYVAVSAYYIFHVLVNFLSEILRFANRDFYRDWWNFNSVRDFWSRWNLPVHKWCIRHIYGPIQKHGYSKFAAGCGVFLFSGLMHEYMCCAPAGFFSLNFTLGLFMQAPAMALETKCKRRKSKAALPGNTNVWGAFLGITGFMMGIITFRMKSLEMNGHKAN